MRWVALPLGNVAARVGAVRAVAPHLGHPFLRQRAGLFNGEFAVQTQGRFAALPGIGAVLEHEHLAACRCNLAHETRHDGIAQLDGLRLGLRRINGGLGELELCHDDSSERPVFQEPHRGQQRGRRVRLRNAPA